MEEILLAVLTLAPDCVVVIAEAKVQRKFARYPPVVLSVEIPVGVPDSKESGEPDFRQDERIVVFQVREISKLVGGEIVGLLRSQPFIKSVGTNLGAELQLVGTFDLSHRIENLKNRERSDLVKGVRSWQRA
jgi:hypothetical protein